MRARDVNRRIEAYGSEVVRQRGSHRFYGVTRKGITCVTTVAQHPGDIPRGALHAIEKDLEPTLGEGWLR